MLRSCGFRLLAVMTIVLAVAGTGFAFPPPDGKGGGNGGGGGEDPPESQVVAYGLFILSMPGDYAGGTATIQEMNENGEGVGYYPDAATGWQQPFYFDIHSGDSVVTNVNDIEIDENYPVPSGWYVLAALGINAHGDIALALALESDPDVVRGGVLQLRPDVNDLSLLPRVLLLPDEAWTHTYARSINDDGIVLGHADDVTSYVYRTGLRNGVADPDVQILPLTRDAYYAEMNNSTAEHGTQIIQSTSEGIILYDVDSSQWALLALDVESVTGLSDSGSFCGSRKRKGNKQTGYIYDGMITNLTGSEGASAINSVDDVIENHSYDTILYHAQHGVLPLDPLVVTMNQSDQDLWDAGDELFNGVTDRDVYGSDAPEFPIVFGSLRNDREFSFQYDAYVLFPLAPPN